MSPNSQVIVISFEITLLNFWDKESGVMWYGISRILPSRRLIHLLLPKYSRRCGYEELGCRLSSHDEWRRHQFSYRTTRSFPLFPGSTLLSLIKSVTCDRMSDVSRPASHSVHSFGEGLWLWQLGRHFPVRARYLRDTRRPRARAITLRQAAAA